MGADPAFSLRFLECGFSRACKHFGLVTRLAWSRERGMVAVLAYPYLLRAFPGCLVALTLRSHSASRIQRHLDVHEFA